MNFSNISMFLSLTLTNLNFQIFINMSQINFTTNIMWNDVDITILDIHNEKMDKYMLFFHCLN